MGSARRTETDGDDGPGSSKKLETRRSGGSRSSEGLSVRDDIERGIVFTKRARAPLRNLLGGRDKRVYGGVEKEHSLVCVSGFCTQV